MAGPADNGSIHLVARCRAGDLDAAAELHDRYLRRLVALARSRISGKLARRIDPEDIVQSAYRSFFAAADRYVLERSGDLWRLLSAITINKVLRQVQHHRRGKRALSREESVCRADGQAWLPADALAAGPSPEEALAIIDELEQFMRRLEPLHRDILEMRLQGLGTEEIAARCSRSERTVRRVLDKLRQALEQRLLDGG